MYLFFKRSFDLLLSLAILIVISPIFVPIMVGLRLTGEGYVWYFQERVGYKNERFNIWKFATMLLDSPNMAGGVLTTRKDPRITPMGGFLRKTKINELPQLINIVRGEMSFVGPRPVMPVSFDQYPANIQDTIYSAKPGLTGIGSVVFRDEEEIISQSKERGQDPWELYAKKIYPHKGELELWYLENRSVWVDLIILFSTAWVIAFPASNLIYTMLPGLPRRDFN